MNAKVVPVYRRKHDPDAIVQELARLLIQELKTAEPCGIITICTYEARFTAAIQAAFNAGSEWQQIKEIQRVAD